MSKQLQFKLRNILWAIFWLSVSGGSFSFLKCHWHYDPLPSQQFPVWMTPPIVLLLAHLVVWSPFVAVGALLGYTKRGMIAGLVAILLFWILLWIRIPTVR